MSYDILFVPRRPGQSWEQALDEAEGRDVLGDAVRPERAEQWDRVEDALRRRVGDVDVRADRDVREAVHHGTGLVVSLYPDEASVTFPYADRDDQGAFHDLVVDVVGLLERETGLLAWDAQTAEPFDGRVHDETGLEAARRIGQETSDVSATEAMAARAEAGHEGPDTGPTSSAAVAGATNGSTGSPAGTAAREGATPGPTAPADPLLLARERRRALFYVAAGLGILVVSLVLRQGDDQPSTLSGVAMAIGVFDLVLGGLLYLGWRRRAEAAEAVGAARAPGPAAGDPRAEGPR